PFLDRELVEHVQRLGAPFKVRHGVRKWLHKRVARKFLPPEIVNRKKRGFAVNVVDAWFRDSVQGSVQQYLSDPSSLMYQYLRHDSVTSLLQKHSTGEDDNHKILFSLVVLEQWLRQSGASSAQ